MPTSARSESPATSQSHASLVAESRRLKAAGRREEALRVDREAVARFPRSGVAWHNLAASLGDLGHAGEAVAAVERAFDAGLDAPETWLTYANAQVALNDMDAAEHGFVEALRRRSAYAPAALSLARLRWMRTGDWEPAMAPLRDALAAGGEPVPLLLFSARLLETAGFRAQVGDLFEEALRRHPENASVVRAAAEFLLAEGELARAVVLSERAVALDPGFVAARVQAAAVYLALGRTGDALAAARRAIALDPSDQSGWGWLATAARAAGAPEADALNHYGTLVRSYRLRTPRGWTSLAAFLADLARTLRRLHVFRAQPAEQSLRGGAQTGANLLHLDDPVVRAFFQAVRTPIAHHLAELGHGDDPVRARNSGAFRIDDAWSVLLKPGGFHASHFHPGGWLSSAFYVELPQAALDGPRREGWIQFGQPPSATSPPLGPQHFVRPEPGLLVLFPSYMWHATVPFTTPESRLTIAFDVLPG
jgi:uncharacterized protein (TIGR02466 family)